MTTLPKRTRAVAAAGTAAILVLAACSSDGEPSESDSSELTLDVSPVVAGEPFPDDRCEANRDAGTITFLSGFDYAAAASIVDPIVAEAKGYYDDLCLDVEIKSGLTTSNYPLIASGEAQAASGGSFSEVVLFGLANDTSFVVGAVEGMVPIDTLIVKPDGPTDIEGLAGTTIGVKGKLPASIETMLLDEGLADGEDFTTVQLEGFDPVAQFEIDSIVGLPGYKSNEPGTLERAGIDFHTFDPTEFGVPGSFGVVLLSDQFVNEHPVAAQDFMRATMKGLADAIADPAAASQAAIDLINSSGNQFFLSPESEVFRWETESQMVVDSGVEGQGLGVPRPDDLQQEIDAYDEVGFFGDVDLPSAAETIGPAVLDGVYDDQGVVIWPS